MFTTLNNILGTGQPRHAEQNDTRQDIQRHDPEYERRKRKKQNAEGDPLNSEEGATVSIEALQLFLNKFLKELSEKPKQGFNAQSQADTQKNNENQAIKKQEQRAQNPAAHAANAYQHMAERGQRTSILGDINENNADLISLDAAEVRTIHALLADLKLLSDKNIEYLHIERAESFLQSLVKAVETVKKSNIFKA